MSITVSAVSLPWKLCVNCHGSVAVDAPSDGKYPLSLWIYSKWLWSFFNSRPCEVSVSWTWFQTNLIVLFFVQVIVVLCTENVSFCYDVFVIMMFSCRAMIVTSAHCDHESRCDDFRQDCRRSHGWCPSYRFRESRIEDILIELMIYLDQIVYVIGRKWCRSTDV